MAKAIERAQNTVEARNAEMRKDNLKYDEVMDQQRKVIYERRLQIIDGDDLEERTEDLLVAAIERSVAEFCPSEYAEEWDLKGLIDAVTQYYPTRFSVEDLSQAATTEDLVESIVEEALEYYEKHAESMPGGVETMRQIERDVMLQILDQRWRDHLAEMDNLKDGIHLRWTVQADPLNAWQSEGYNLFGQLMEVIDNDYLRYILHVEAIQEPAIEPDLDRAVYVAAEDPVAADECAGRRAGRRDGGQRRSGGAGPAPGGLERVAERGEGVGQEAECPGPRCPGTHHQGGPREGGPQRPLLVREREEIQVVPWRRLRAVRPRYPGISRPSWQSPKAG